MLLLLSNSIACIIFSAEVVLRKLRLPLCQRRKSLSHAQNKLGEHVVLLFWFSWTISLRGGHGHTMILLQSLKWSWGNALLLCCIKPKINREHAETALFKTSNHMSCDQIKIFSFLRKTFLTEKWNESVQRYLKIVIELFIITLIDKRSYYIDVNNILSIVWIWTSMLHIGSWRRCKRSLWCSTSCECVVFKDIKKSVFFSILSSVNVHCLSLHGIF